MRIRHYFYVMILLFLVHSFAFASSNESDKKTYDTLMAKLDHYQGENGLLESVARQFYKQTQDNPNNELAYTGLARVTYLLGYINKNNYSKRSLELAKQIIDQALRINPNNVDANVYAGFIELYKRNFQLAKAFATSAEKFNPNSPRLLLLWTNIYDITKNIDKMIEFAKETKKYAPNNGMKVKANHSITRGYRLLKDFEKAENIYKENIALSPNSAWVHINYASFLVKRKRADEAIKMAKKSLAIKDFGMGHHILGKAYYRKGANLYWKGNNKLEGAKYFERALQEDDTLVNANYGLGLHLFKVGQREYDVEKMKLGKFYLETALKHKPKHKKAKFHLERANHYIEWLIDRGYIESELTHSTRS